MKDIEIRLACEKIVNRIVDKEKQESNILFDMNIWDWSQGVALYGIWKYYKLSQDKQYLNYLTQWFDEKLDTEIVHNVNTMAPLLTLCFLYEETNNQKYFAYCIKCAKWLLNDIPKTKMGAIQHITIDSDNYQQIWADTVFMSVLFLGKIAAITNNRDYAGECKKQFLLHIRYLSDHATGLWYHGWSFEHNSNYANALWARGNCWFTIAASEIIDILPMDKWEQDLILNSYQCQVESLISVQHKSGIWHTLLDCPDSYLEVSGSSGIAYGILHGIRKGYLPKQYQEKIKKASEEIYSHIDSEGVVHQVSYGTILADSLEYYKNVALKSTGYGQNLTLMLLVELLTWQANHLDL